MKGISRSKGQALVEIALGLPLVLLLIIGVLELGRAFFTKIAMTNAAREGANFFVYHKRDSDVIDKTKSRVMNEVWNVSEITITPPQVVIECRDVTVDLVNKEIISDTPLADAFDCPRGYTLEVTVSNEYNTIFDFIIGPFTMQANARMVIP